MCCGVVTQAELKRGGLESDEDEEDANDDLFASEGDADGDFNPDAAAAAGDDDGEGNGDAAPRPSGGRLRRRAAAAAAGDEQMGETDAGQAAPMTDDIVFAPMEMEDGDMQDEVCGVWLLQGGEVLLSYVF
jgi:hypothetical protein